MKGRRATETKTDSAFFCSVGFFSFQKLKPKKLIRKKEKLKNRFLKVTLGFLFPYPYPHPKNILVIYFFLILILIFIYVIYICVNYARARVLKNAHAVFKIAFRF